MSVFYQIAYRIGFMPWEEAATHRTVAEHIARLLDREEHERQPPLGAALDLGCGTGAWTIELARRGWVATGVDLVPTAIAKARKRAAVAGARVRLIEGDLTALRAAGVGEGFRFFLDFGAIHGLTPAQRLAAGREITAVASPDATMLMLAWAPGRRGLLPRGVSRTDIEEAFPVWAIVDEQPLDASALPRPLRKVDPRCYRLRRAEGSSDPNGPEPRSTRSAGRA